LAAPATASCREYQKPNSLRLQGPQFNFGIHVCHTIVVLRIQTFLEQLSRDLFVATNFSLHGGIKE
jgi:hypothetical protein